MAANAVAIPAIFIWWPPPGVKATTAEKTRDPAISKAAAPQRHKGSPIAREAPTKPTIRTRVKLSITASRGASWILIRRDSTTGSVLYAGTLTQGRSVVLTGPKLYAEFGALRNLDVYMGRVSVDLSCYANRGVFLTADGVLPRPSKSCLLALGS
jgi:hypothetical protein